MSARTPEEAHALLVAAFNDGDPDALADVYEEEAALVVPPDGRQVSVPPPSRRRSPRSSRSRRPRASTSSTSSRPTASRSPTRWDIVALTLATSLGVFKPGRRRH